MLNLATQVAGVIPASLEQFLDSPLLAAPAMESDYAALGANPTQTAFWMDPIFVALLVAAGLFLISWRISMRRGPD